MLSSFAYEVTPLMIGGEALPRARRSPQVATIDAATGQTIWTFNPEAYRRRTPRRISASCIAASHTGRTENRSGSSLGTAEPLSMGD